MLQKLLPMFENTRTRKPRRTFGSETRPMHLLMFGNVKATQTVSLLQGTVGESKTLIRGYSKIPDTQNSEQKYQLMERSAVETGLMPATT